MNKALTSTSFAGLTGTLNPNDVGAAVVEALVRVVGKDPSNAMPRDWFHAIAYYVRGYMAERWLKTKSLQHAPGAKTVYYLSMEFLIGRSLKNNLFNLSLDGVCREALGALGVDLDDLYEEEFEAALGNGGLGRLAACFLDSLTALGYPAQGYGCLTSAPMGQISGIA